MSNYLARTGSATSQTTQDIDNAVQRGFLQALNLAISSSRELVIFVPSIQHLDSTHIASALGNQFAKALKKPQSFNIKGVNISRYVMKNSPSAFPSPKVILAIWPTLNDITTISAKYGNSSDVVVIEWIPYGELDNWVKNNNPSII